MRTPTHHLATFIIIIILQLLPSSMPAATPPNTTISADYPPDPFQLNVPRSTTSLAFSGFRYPIISYFTPLQLFDIAQRAQSEIVEEILQARGDARIAQPNFEWCSDHGIQPLCFRLNHNIDHGLTWTMLSAAMRGMIEYGWDTNFAQCRSILVLDRRAGIVARGELLFDWTTTS